VATAFRAPVNRGFKPGGPAHSRQGAGIFSGRLEAAYLLAWSLRERKERDV